MIRLGCDPENLLYLAQGLYDSRCEVSEIQDEKEGGNDPKDDVDGSYLKEAMLYGTVYERRFRELSYAIHGLTKYTYSDHDPRSLNWKIATSSLQ